MNPSVLFIPEAFWGGYRIRSEWPAAALRERGWDAKVMYPAWDPKARADVVVIHRAMAPSKAEMVEHFHRVGARVLLQEDDLQYYANPHIESLQHRAYPAAKWAHEQAVAACDGMVVTTAELVRTYTPKVRPGRPVHLVRNYLPAWVGRAGRKHGGAHTILGYRGSVANHRVDVAWIKPRVSEMMDGSKMMVVGERAVWDYWNIDEAHRDLAWDWTNEPAELYRRMARADLAIVPLAPIRFNQAKSWLAALEWSTVGVPVVAAATEQNIELAELVPIELAATPEAMATLVRSNLEMGKGRLRVRGGQAAAAAARITLEARIEEWEEALCIPA